MLASKEILKKRFHGYLHRIHELFHGSKTVSGYRVNTVHGSSMVPIHGFSASPYPMYTQD